MLDTRFEQLNKHNESREQASVIAVDITFNTWTETMHSD